MHNPLSLILALVALFSFCARALALCLRNRRNPAPNREQILEGLGCGVGIGGALVAAAFWAAQL